MVRRVALLMILASCARGDDAGSSAPDGGRSRGPSCPVDEQEGPESAAGLSLGTRYAEDTHVCPPSDTDWFRFTLPPDQPLVQIELAYPEGATSPVELAYDLFTASDLTRPLAGGRDENSGDNRSRVQRRHYLDASGGTYYLRVSDTGDDEQDVRNSYGLEVSASADPDPSEPNENCEAATALTLQAGAGAIAADGDRDAFRLDVPAGSHIIDIRLTTMRASAVDLRLSLLRPDGTLATAVVDPRGEDGATDLRLRYGIEGTGGSHCVVVEDDDGRDVDPDGSYALLVSAGPEIDENEMASRNDHPEGATPIASAMRRTGIIASHADHDWYAVTARSGLVIEVELDCPNCEIQPSISFIYGHTNSNCALGSACDYLLENGTCQTDADCGSGVCRSTPSGRKCALHCDHHLDCPGFSCQETGAISACAGAGVCMPGGLCGVEQYTVTATNGVLRVAQPARASTYLLVHDFGDDEFTQASYTLDVRTAADPDSNEPNNLYVPYASFDASDIVRRGRPRATRVTWEQTEEQPPRARASGRGCIGYTGDIDLFRLEGQNPCQVATSSAGLRSERTGHCGLELTYSRPAPSLDLAYFVQTYDGALRASFGANQEGDEVVFGDGRCGSPDPECMFYYGGDEEDYLLVVRDFGQDGWSLSPGDCYTWTLTSAPDFGCPASCPTPHPSGGLCYCPP